MRRILTVILMLLLWVISTANAQSSTGDLLGSINALRASVGVHPYSPNPALNAAAQSHAEWMVQTGRVDHVQENGSTPAARAQAAGYSSQWVSENIYMGGLATAQVAMQFWTNSPVHYRGMTASHYYDIGIASAQGNGQTAYVLVFGNPNPARTVSSSAPVAGGENTAGGASTGASANQPPPPPSFIIGRDEWGNALHEVQPGHTLGEIVLMYGYNWGDLDLFRYINSMTEWEGRNLAIGDAVRVPPRDGTWTPAPGTPSPTPFVTGTFTPPPAEPTEPPLPTDTPTATDSAPYEFPTLTPIVIGAPTDEPTATPTDEPTPEAIADEAPADDSANFPTLTPVIIATSTPETPTTAAESVAWLAATMTPVGGEAVAQADSAGTVIEEVIAPASGLTVSETAAASAPDDGGGIPPLLLLIVGAQVLILLGAWFEFSRRSSA